MATWINLQLTKKITKVLTKKSKKFKISLLNETGSEVFFLKNNTTNEIIIYYKKNS